MASEHPYWCGFYENPSHCNCSRAAPSKRNVMASEKVEDNPFADIEVVIEMCIEQTCRIGLVCTDISHERIPLVSAPKIHETTVKWFRVQIKEVEGWYMYDWLKMKIVALEKEWGKWLLKKTTK